MSSEGNQLYPPPPKGIITKGDIHQQFANKVRELYQMYSKVCGRVRGVGAAGGMRAAPPPPPPPKKKTKKK
jgi:hypothetical protein